jgi:phospholipid/cholesterol/gamma-HCH transport system permease protein
MKNSIPKTPQAFPGNPDQGLNFSIQEGALSIGLIGRIDRTTCSGLLKSLHLRFEQPVPGDIVIDFSRTTRFDEYGVLVLLEIQRLARKSGKSVSLVNAKETVSKVLQMTGFDHIHNQPATEKPRTPNAILRLGIFMIQVVQNAQSVITFLGNLILLAWHVLRHPQSLRYDDMVLYMRTTGVDALPIVGLISFLLGLIMAFMSSLQLAQFGANVFVASLVALAMVSELGPIMTAIVIAGRSGSAYAAEIATMGISEEIDALKTMGFDPVLFLALPRMTASMLTIPILTLFSDVFAIAGGLLIGVTMLDLTPVTYMSQTLKSLRLFDVVWGMLKSVVFAFLISWVGCLRGFQAKGGASAVGQAATSSVVTSIFLIILFDSIFAVVRSYL